MALTRPKAYQIYDIDYKQAVRVVAISNVTLAGGAPNSVDGVNLSLNDRILVTGQNTGSQNGIYYVTTVGSGSNGTWARSTDTNATGELLSGTIVMVTEGITYADTQWKLTTDNPITIGSTALTFVQNYLANSISFGQTSFAIGSSNANATVSVAGISNVAVFSTGGANITGGLNINSTDGNYNVLNISGAALGPYGTPQTWQFFTNNIALGSSGSWILFPDSSTQTTAYPGSSSTLSLSGNITGGNLNSNAAIVATGNISGSYILGNGSQLTGLPATYGNTNVAAYLASGSDTSNIITSGNVSGGNILTVGQISSTGTITTAAGTNSTGFAVGNGAVSNVGLGFFPTAGTRGDYAIRDYSSVFSTMYLDVGIGGSAGGEFQFRTGNTYSLSMRANSSGVYSSGVVSATGTVYGSELNSTNSQVNEGGQINLALPSSGSTLVDGVIIDVYQNNLRFFERGGTNRGAYIDLTAASAGVGSNLLAGGGGGGTPGGSNTYVQFNDAGTFGGNGQFTYDKVTNTLTAGIIAANNNATGQNFKVGDDIWIGDINLADTMRLTGQQNGANAYIVFGNADGAQLGRAGTGPLTYAGAFSATGNIIGGNLITSGLVSVTGNVTAGGHVGTIYTNSIINTGANATGNIGSSSLYFNTAFVKATSAQYADVAEWYASDQYYEPGTVVSFGGTQEVTLSSTPGDNAVAGVVSTNPAYIMNAGIRAEYSVPVALTGRVPTKVIGPVRKGNMMVSAGNGYAQACSTPSIGAVIGKAIENFNGDTGVIEIVVGRV